jgi:hypothetical protein
VYNSGLQGTWCWRFSVSSSSSSSSICGALGVLACGAPDDNLRCHTRIRQLIILCCGISLNLIHGARHMQEFLALRALLSSGAAARHCRRTAAVQRRPACRQCSSTERYGGARSELGQVGDSNIQQSLACSSSCAVRQRFLLGSPAPHSC